MCSSPPQAPCIRTAIPALSCPTSKSAIHPGECHHYNQQQSNHGTVMDNLMIPVMIPAGIAAASGQDILFGMGKHSNAGQQQNSENPPPSNIQHTRSPSSKISSPEPMATISPAISNPKTDDCCIGATEDSFICAKSDPQSPAVRTRTKSSPGPGHSIGISSISNLPLPTDTQHFCILLPTGGHSLEIIVNFNYKDLSVYISRLPLGFANTQ
jgi:hypothetical protein